VLVAATALVVVPAAVPGGNPGFFVGFSDDLPKQVGAAAVTPAAQLGAKAFRFTLQWSPGQTDLSSADAAVLSTAVSAASAMRVVLAVYGTSGSAAPTSATQRDQYCGYVRAVLARYPAIRDVVIWNEPNKNQFWSPQLNADGSPASPSAYEALLATCYDVLHAAFPGVNVIGLAISHNGSDDASSLSPGTFVRDVGIAYRASGRQARLLDTVAFHPYPLSSSERPWAQHIGVTMIAEGDWNKLMYNLWLAFNGTGQPIPGQGGVTIWYTEVGFQTSVPAAKASLYSGTENVATVPDYAGGEPDSPPPAATSPAPDQATQALDSIRLAACQPYVGAIFNFLIADEPVLAGWQSGPLWVDRTQKASFPAFQQAIAAASGGTLDCASLKGGQPSADFMPPSAPTNLAGQPQTGPLRVDLSWSAASDDASAITYRIYRDGSWVGTTTATSWTNSAVSEAKTYIYSVRAIDAAGNLGDASSPLTVTTPDLTAPSAPAAFAAQAASNPGRVVLSWQASTDNVGVSAYEVSRNGTVIGSAATESYTDSSAAGVTGYTYSVVALDAAGNRSASATVFLTTPDFVPPSAPGQLTTTASDGPPQVALTWVAASDDVGVTGYDVLRDGSVLGSTASTSWTDTAVAAGQTHIYAVRARDAAGNIGPTASLTVQVPDTTAPSSPSGLKAQALTRPPRVSLTWTASTDNVAVVGYRVFREGILIATVSATSYVDSSVSAAKTYHYAVAAFDTAGNQSATSATVKVTTAKK